MHLTAAVLCVFAMLGGAAVCVVHPNRSVGWWEIAVSLLWFPLNNHALEGPVVLSLAGNHGVTVADVGGLVGFLVGALRVWPLRTWRPWPTIAVRAVALLALLALAAATAASETDQLRQPARHLRPHPNRTATAAPRSTAPH